MKESLVLRSEGDRIESCPRPLLPLLPLAQVPPQLTMHPVCSPVWLGPTPAVGSSGLVAPMGKPLGWLDASQSTLSIAYIKTRRPISYSMLFC